MNVAEYLFENAVMAFRSGRSEEAAAILEQVISHNQRHAHAWALRGLLENAAGRHFNAMLHYDFAVAADPDQYDIWADRGIALSKEHARWDAARQSYERSLALKESFEGHYNYGKLLTEMMEIDKAAEHLKAAYEINPKDQQLNALLGHVLITQGKWREGYSRHRYRFGAPLFPTRLHLPYREWEGQDLNGKTILLYVEQGFGDEIMSLRFASAVKAAGARVILSVRPLMYRLAQSFTGADAIILQYDPPPWEPDYMCSLLDVPAFLDIGPDNLPGKAGYLKAEQRPYRLQWPDGYRVGICWASGKRANQPHVAATAKAKSLSIEAFAPLARPGVVLLSLQKEHTDHKRMVELGIKDPMAGVMDFADTAWIMNDLDLVITVDTSVAHLAGALGKPVINLVRFDAIWPWMREDTNTCWYDSMTVCRQTKPFDWKDPLVRMLQNFELRLMLRLSTGPGLVEDLGASAAA